MNKIFNSQFSIIDTLKFLWNKPKIVIVAGNGRFPASFAISKVLGSRFKVGKEVLVFEADLSDSKTFEKLRFLIKKSPLPVLVATHIGEIPPDRYFFSGSRSSVKGILKLAELFPSIGQLVLNFDDETVREIKNRTPAHSLTFGFQEGADMLASDINLNTGTNFKINFRGNIVPCWLENLFGKEYIYAAMAAASCGAILGMNLIEVSQSLRLYQGVPGKMKLIKGIKHSWILDDSRSASSFSMMEALQNLGRINISGRRIAVLGDILGIGKYTIEVHESIGERVARTADLLFTVGPRARFFAKGAIVRGMPEDSIFQFDEVKSASLALQKEIKEGDLILVDGSTEMKMKEIVEEIRQI